MLFRILDYAHFLMNLQLIPTSHLVSFLLMLCACILRRRLLFFQVLSPEDFKQLRKLRLQKSIEQPSCKQESIGILTWSTSICIWSHLADNLAFIRYDKMIEYPSSHPRDPPTVSWTEKYVNNRKQWTTKGDCHDLHAIRDPMIPEATGCRWAESVLLRCGWCPKVSWFLYNIYIYTLIYINNYNNNS